MSVNTALRPYCVFTLLALCFGSPAIAQNASLAGTTTDASGAAIAAASVTLIDETKGTQRMTVTDISGRYSLQGVAPGVYTVKVSATGFRTAIEEQFTVAVAEHARFDVEMEVGVNEQSIRVEGASEGINTVDASVSSVISRTLVDGLPLNGRSFHSLIELAPGVVQAPTNEASRGSYSVNGQRANSNSYMVDGVSVNLGVGASQSMGQSGTGTNIGTSAVGGTNNLVSLDALEEFRVVTSTFAPEYGRTPGGQVSVVTRSGNNSFHGTLFEYFRNEKLDANDWFLNRAGIARPPLRQNDFGGVLGGPVLKDRTFFFASYEALRLRQPSAGITDVPSLELRRTAPEPVRVFLNAYPIPTGAAGVNGLAPVLAGVTNPSSLNALGIRIDHHAGNHVQLFGRLNSAPSSGRTRGGSNSLNSVQVYDARVWTATTGVVAIFSPSVTNDLRFNVSRAQGNNHAEMDDFGGAVPLPDSVAFRPGYSSEDSSLLFNIQSGIGARLFTGLVANTISKQWALVETLTAVRNKHQLKFGVDWRRLHTTAKLPRLAVSPFMNGEAAILSGTTGGGMSVYGPSELLFSSWSAFAQDTWAINPRLTATYGLRWEVNPPPGTSGGNHFLALNPFSDPAKLSLASAGTAVYQARYNMFAPRLGLAYQLRDGRWGTVLRAGAGLFFDTGYGRLGSLVGNGASAFSSQLTLASTTPFPIPLDVAPAPFSTKPPFTNFIGLDPTLTLPRTWQWNVALEQTLPGSQSFSVTYVGAAGRKLFVGEQFANLNADFLSRTTIGTNNSRSDYHSMQVVYQRRFSQRLNMLASYTWAHAIDTTSNDTVDILHPANYYPNQNRGNADFDLRHNFSSALVYQIPALRGLGKGARLVFSSWELDSVIRARSAPPVDITGSRNITGVAGVVSRVNVIPDQPLYLYDASIPGGRRFNPSAFAIPAVSDGFVQGTLGRNVLRGFNFGQIDLSLNRTFRMTERVSLQFRGELFNATNRANFGPPPGRCCSSTFGVSSSMFGRSLNSASNGGFNSLYQVGGPRSTQLALRLRF